MLPAKHLKYKPLGGEFLVQLDDGASQGHSAGSHDLTIWTTAFQVNYPATIDPGHPGGRVLDQVRGHARRAVIVTVIVTAQRIRYCGSQRSCRSFCAATGKGLSPSMRATAAARLRDALNRGRAGSSSPNHSSSSTVSARPSRDGCPAAGGSWLRDGTMESGRVSIMLEDNGGFPAV